MAEILHLSISSVNRGFKAKIPPFHEGFRIGRRVLFPISSLQSAPITGHNEGTCNE